jgi:hypothetical protein
MFFHFEPDNDKNTVQGIRNGHVVSEMGKNEAIFTWLIAG